MKSNRIFITNDTNDYSEKEFNGIKVENLAARIASVRESLAESKLPDELRDQVSSMNFGEETTERSAKKELPEALKQYQFKSKEDETDEEEGEKDAEMIKKGKEAKAFRTRKLLFNDPSQISASALRAVEASGDFALANTIKAVRNEARQHLAAKLDEQAQRLAVKSNKASKRHAVRMKIVDNAKTAMKVAEKAKVSTERANNEPTPISKLSTTEREIAVRKAKLNGWSDEYINAFFGSSFQDRDLSEIKSVMASDLPKSTKIAAVTGLVKVATLDKDNLDRLKRYWKDELGYGDEAWIDDLFTNKYDKKKGE